MVTFRALERLGAAGPKSELKALSEDQLWGKNVFMPHGRGDSTRESPWFWFVGRPDSVSREEWMIKGAVFITAIEILVNLSSSI